MDLQGKVAVITGGGVRLGRAMTLALAREGVNLCVHYSRSADAADETCRSAQAHGVETVSVRADFSQPVEAARAVVETALDAFGRIDVLVNSAAIFEAGTLADTTEDQWDRHLNINLKAPAFLCREFAKQIAPDRRGHIVNVADWRALRPGAGYLAYTVAKAGLVALTRSLAMELAPAVQVNAVAPGAVLPPADKPADYLEQLAAQIPLHRVGGPDDVTDVLLFLLRSDFITGEVIHVTGGQEL